LRTSISHPAAGFRFFSSSSNVAAVISRAGSCTDRSHWLVPDLAFLAAAVVLFYSLFLFGGYQAFFHDSDAGWHIRTGEQILRSGILPRTDPFSFTAAGKPWFAWEWLADVLVGTLYRFSGLAGVALFYSAALAVTVWLWFRLNWIAGGNFFLAALFAAPMLSTTNLHWLARPHVLSWIFLLLTVRFAIRPQFDRRSYAVIALVSGLWANIHASFLIGPAILALFAICEALHPFVFSANSSSTGSWPVPVNKNRSQARNFSFAAAVALAATFVNPYGAALHRHVIAYLMDSALLDRVGEFQSFNFHLAGSTQIILALGIAAAGAIFALSQGKLASFWKITFLLVLALRSARGLPLVALLALPLANGTITEALRSATGLNSSFRRFLDRALAYSDRLRAIDIRSSGLVWAPALLLLAAFALRTPSVAAHTGFPTSEFPVAASAVIETLPAGARIFAPDKFGGYLIYRFAGARKVFFDGRSDLYGARFLTEYGDLSQLRPGWQTIFNRYGFTHALLPPNAPLAPALEAAGWTTLYQDPVATLLASPRN